MRTVQKIIELATKLAPAKLAASWDNVGLTVGDYNQVVNRVLLSLDVNYMVLEEAISKGCQLIIAHHPFIFQGMKSIRSDDVVGRIIMKAVKNDISIFSAHTNLDIATKGLNDYLANILEIRDLVPIDITQKTKYYKLVVFTPDDYFERVRTAILDAGAGHIGNYSHTSFSVKGEGTFKAQKGSNPFIGQVGETSNVQESRFETLITEDRIDSVVNEMLKAHPYEEVAYDLYPLLFEGDKYGFGRVGKLDNKVRLIDYLDKVKLKLNLSYLRYVGEDDAIIQKIAVCSGSGVSLIKQAKATGADLYITGDVKFHEAQMAKDLGLNLLDAGHYETEVIVKNMLLEYFKRQSTTNNLQVDFIKSEVNTNPWK
ncbi:Nif3-like dinuclear metal center hexameric protein [Alkaliphilus transvaalensis]|nr:Nif3-like dinuclear metal center hexameric protein [Alkaliphilus transvaalensis]